MRNSKNPKTAELAEELAEAANSGRLIYLEARTPIRIDAQGKGSAPEVKLREFELTKGEQ